MIQGGQTVFLIPVNAVMRGGVNVNGGTTAATNTAATNNNNVGIAFTLQQTNPNDNKQQQQYVLVNNGNTSSHITTGEFCVVSLEYFLKVHVDFRITYLP